MADVIYTLTDDDRNILRDLIADWKRRLRNQPRQEEVDEEQGTTEVYVARSPAAGIPALTEDIGASIADEPGYADCYIYRIVINAGIPELQPISNFFRRIYNLCTEDIPGDSWLIVARDKFGFWFG